MRIIGVPCGTSGSFQLSAKPGHTGFTSPDYERRPESGDDASDDDLG